METPKAKTWQELADEYHMMMGYCIAEWATIDESLFRIFRDCIGPYEQSAILYYRIRGLETRLQATDEIVKSVLTKHNAGNHRHINVKMWNRIMDRFPDLLSVRRRIVHQPVSIQFLPNRRVTMPSVNTEVFARYYAAPEPLFKSYMSRHEELRDRKKPNPLHVNDLQNHVRQLRDISVDLLRFLR